MSGKRCLAVTRAGVRCQIEHSRKWWLGADDRCLWHSTDPALTAKRQAVCAARGRERRRRYCLRMTRPTQLQNIEDALAWQVWVTEQLADCQLDPKVAQQITKSVECWLRAQGYAVKLQQFRKTVDDLKKAAKAGQHGG